MPQRGMTFPAQRVSQAHKGQTMKLSEVLERLDEKATMVQLSKLYGQAMNAIPGSKKQNEIKKKIKNSKTFCLRMNVKVNM